MIVDWTFNGFFWLGLGLGFGAYIGDASQPFRTIALVVASLASVAYFSNAFMSPHCIYISHQLSPAALCEYMDTLYKSKPKVLIYAENCSQQPPASETESIQSLEEDKDNTITRASSKEFPYASCRDVSGKLQLAEGLDKDKAKSAYVKLELEYRTHFANDGSGEDFVVARERLKDSAKQDAYQRCWTHFDVENSRKLVLVQTSEMAVPFFGLGWFLFFTVLALHAPYRTYVDRFCHTQHYLVQKVISTRQDLASPELDDSYDYYTPHIVFPDHEVVFRCGSPPETRTEPWEPAKFPEKPPFISLDQLPKHVSQESFSKSMLMDTTSLIGNPAAGTETPLGHFTGSIYPHPLASADQPDEAKKEVRKMRRKKKKGKKRSKKGKKANLERQLTENKNGVTGTALAILTARSACH